MRYAGVSCASITSYTKEGTYVNQIDQALADPAKTVQSMRPQEPQESTEPTTDERVYLPADPWAVERRLSTTLDLTTPENARQLGEATAGTHPKISDMVGKTLLVENATMFVRQVSNDKEDFKEAAYLVLHLAGGAGYVECASRGCIESLPYLAAAFGRPPWLKGCPVIVLKKGRLIMLRAGVKDAKKK